MENRAKVYWRHRYISGFAGLIILLLYLALIQFSGASYAIKAASLSLSGNTYISLAIYLIIINLGALLVTLPVSFYEGFIVEHKFSLSNQDPATWIKDEAKKIAISTVIFVIVVEIFYAVAYHVAAWWIAASVLWVVFSVIFVKLFPVLIIPFFYKCKALTDRNLRDRMLELASRFGIKMVDAFEMDFSRTTKKSNAALVGWGNTRRMLLTDNLLNEFTPDEVVVVAAHEMAHHALRHISKMLFLEAASATIFFFLLSRVFDGLIRLLGAAGPFDMAIFPALWLIFLIYNLVTMPVQNGFSRTMERNADLLALKVTGLKNSFISLMKKLAEKNLADESPNRIVELLLYNHPPIRKRIELAENYEKITEGSRQRPG